VATTFEAAVQAQAEGGLEAAIEGYRQVLQADPRHMEALLRLGIALTGLDRRAEALGCWQRVLEIHPRHAAAHNNIGAVYLSLGRLREAEHHMRLAVEGAPNDAAMAINLANVAIELGKPTEAMALAGGVIEREPEHAHAHLTLGFSLVHQGEIDAAIAAFRACYERNIKASLAFSNVLLNSLYSARTDEEVLALHRELAVRIPAAGPARTRWSNSRERERKLRIGYLSPDLRAHPVAAFLRPLLENHDTAAFDAYCYSTTGAPDVVTERVRENATVWRPCPGWSDARIAEEIERDGIDILVDLSGHTAQNRAGVLRARPAPIQALYIGYPGTSGLQEMDYIVADRYVCPEGSERLYTERIARIEGSFWCYRPRDVAPAVSSLPAKANGHVTFGSYNALPKLQRATISLWAEVVRAVPGSRLALKALPFNDERVRDAVRRRFAETGLPGERLDLLGPTEPRAFLQEYARLDIALDPFPYNGGMTTCEALWMGVPVVSLSGGRFCSRMGVSILHNVGLPQFAVGSREQYVAAAVALANDIPALEGLRAGLRERVRASALCDGASVTRQLEKAYRAMWHRYVDG
jgi:protein O-GlcNAc transferase